MVPDSVQVAERPPPGRRPLEATAPAAGLAWRRRAGPIASLQQLLRLLPPPVTVRLPTRRRCWLLVAVLLLAGLGAGCHRAEPPRQASEQRARELWQLANQHLRAGKYRRALQEFERAAETAPAYVGRYQKVGIALYDSGQYQHARRCFDFILARQPDNASTFNSRGLLYERLHDTTQAARDYRRAIVGAPTMPQPYVNLATLYQNADCCAQGIKVYTALLRVAPTHVGAWVNRGVLKSRNGDYPGALADQERAVALDSLEHLAYSNRGMAKLRLHRYAEAVVDFTRAIRIKTDYPLAYNNRGNAYFALGQLDAACANWQLVLQHGYRYDPAWLTNWGVQDPALLVQRYCR